MGEGNNRREWGREITGGSGGGEITGGSGGGK